jgi:hypothetical protein
MGSNLGEAHSTAFWYQVEPHAAFPEVSGLNGLEVV